MSAVRSMIVGLFPDLLPNGGVQMAGRQTSAVLIRIARERVSAHHLRIAGRPFQVEKDFPGKAFPQLRELFAKIGPEARLKVRDGGIRLDRPERRVVPGIVGDQGWLRRIGQGFSIDAIDPGGGGAGHGAVRLRAVDQQE